MARGSFRFERFALDPHDRQLRRDGAPVALNARYLDALALMVREPGRLIAKERFLDEVWRGAAVTDEALSQCIRTLRQRLGDDAARPRFIETVPKHGYRFVATVDWVEAAPEPAAAHGRADRWRRLLALGAAGMLGGGLAGVAGGLFYGFVIAAAPQASSVGALSMLLVLACVTTVLALVGGAGVAFGVAAAGLAPERLRALAVVGGAAGGLLVGAFVKLLGLDAFNLLLGRAPADMTGAPEGALLGASVGLGAWLAGRAETVRLGRRVATAAAAGSVAGLLISLLGGRLMGGSLELLARGFPDSRLRLDRIGVLFGEAGFGPVSQMVTSALEGALFAGCIVGAMTLAQARLRR